jgi:hypothetical protein
MHWILWVVLIICIFYLLSVISVMVMFGATVNSVDKTILNIKKGL